MIINYEYPMNELVKKEKEIDVNDFVGVKGWKAAGNKILKHKNMSGFKFINNQAAKSCGCGKSFSCG